MSAHVPPMDAPALRQVVGLWPVVVANVVLGLPAYFIAFLFAYGFSEVTAGGHVTFLVLIAIFACTTGLGGGVIAGALRRGQPIARRAVSGVLLSLGLNAAVVAAGSIVSAMNKDQNSVSAGFSTTTDVAVAAVLFLLAAGFGGAAALVERRGVLAAGR